MYEIWKVAGRKSQRSIEVLERTADKHIIVAWYEGTNIELTKKEMEEELLYK